MASNFKTTEGRRGGGGGGKGCQDVPLTTPSVAFALSVGCARHQNENSAVRPKLRTIRQSMINENT